MGRSARDSRPAPRRNQLFYSNISRFIGAVHVASNVLAGGFDPEMITIVDPFVGIIDMGAAIKHDLSGLDLFARGEPHDGDRPIAGN